MIRILKSFITKSNSLPVRIAKLQAALFYTDTYMDMMKKILISKSSVAIEFSAATEINALAAGAPLVF